MLEFRASKKPSAFVFITFTLLLMVTTGASVLGAAPTESAIAIKVPETANDHFELARHYQQEAGQLRAEIDRHKQMLEEYKKTVAKNPKDPSENGYIKSMRLHCEKYINAAETLAAEASESAKFHTLRAKELEGK